ncbi:hypothetical protein [Mycolicibacterium sp. XJ870]
MTINLKHQTMLPLTVLALAALGVIAGPVSAHADPLRAEQGTCLEGEVELRQVSPDGKVSFKCLSGRQNTCLEGEVELRQSSPDGRASFKCLPGRQAPAQQAPAKATATVAGDVDVYNAKNEPDGAGQVVGILRVGQEVGLVGNCSPEAWCQVTGDTVPGGTGWVWGHLQLP